MTDASCVSVVVRECRAGGRHERRLHLLRRPRGWRWVRSAATPATCGAEKLVPSRIANLSPANSSSVDDRICAPGAITSGLSAWPNGVRPPAEKLVGTPAHVVGTSTRVTREAHRRDAAGSRGRGADARAVEIGDRPARKLEDRERRIARAVLGDDHAGGAGLTGPGRLRGVRAAAAADECDRAVERPAGSRVAELTVHAADRPDVADPLVRRDPRRRQVVGERDRNPPDAARCDDRDRRAEDMRVRGRAHADRIGRRRRRARRAEPEEVPVVAGGDDRHDAGANDVRHRRNENVGARVRLRASAREVDDVHPVTDRGLERSDDLRAVRRAAPAQWRGGRDVEHAVVPDLRARRDPGHVVDRRVTPALGLVAEPAPPGLDVRRDPGDDPGDERPVEETSRFSTEPVPPGPAKPRAAITFGDVPPPVPFGNPGGNEKPVGSRNGCSLSTPSSTTATFTPVAPRTRRCSEGRSSDDARPAVEILRVRQARVHALRDFRLEEVRQARRRGRSPRSRSRAPGSGARPRASGISSRSSAIAFAWAASRLLRYERENLLEKFSFAFGPNPAKRRAYVAAASGGSSSVMITRTRLSPVLGKLEASGTRWTFSMRPLDHAPRCPVDGTGRGPGDGDGYEEGGEKR